MAAVHVFCLILLLVAGGKNLIAVDNLLNISFQSSSNSDSYMNVL